MMNNQQDHQNENQGQPQLADGVLGGGLQQPPPGSQNSCRPIDGNLSLDNLTAQSYHQVAGAAVKLHDFETKYPESWFIRAEARFRDCRITAEKTKYNKVVQALSVATIERLSAFFEANPINHDEPYKEIKAALLDSYKKTTSEDLQDLFDSMSLGDKRPSELLSEMTRRAGKDVSDRYLEPLWLARLPEGLSSVVGALSMPLREKGKHADNIQDKCGFRSSSLVAASQSVAAAQAAAMPQTAAAAVAPRSEMEELRQMFSEMRYEIAELKRSRDDNRNSRDHNRDHSRNRRFANRSRSRPREQPDVCWYHETFGDRAQKCGDNCKFAPKN